MPLKSAEENLIDLEASIVRILQEKIEKETVKFTLPVRLAEMQKEIQLSLDIWSPPIFIITKQIDTTVDNLFYKVLEERGNVREQIISYLRTKYSGTEWGDKIIGGLKSEKLHLFMQFTHETVLAM
jgi:hypothetical protein